MAKKQKTKTESKQGTESGTVEKSKVKMTRQEIVREKILEAQGQIEGGYLEMAQLLTEAYHGDFHETWGFETFEAYCDKELDIKYRKARYFIDIWDKVKSLDLPKDQVAALGWCLTADAEVTCNPGRKFIVDVKVGDKVLAPDGTFQHVVETAKMACNRLVEITGDYFGTLSASENHRFDVARFKSKRSTEYEVLPIRADELVEGDYLLYPRVDASKIDIEPFGTFSKEWFYLAGMFVAEGNVYGGQVRIRLGKDAEAELDYLFGIAERCYPEMNVRKQVFKDDSSFGLSIGKPMGSNRGDSVANKFLDWFGDRHDSKTFPEAFFGLDHGRLSNFLLGLHVGDGSQSRKTIRVMSTTSKVLADRIGLLMSRFDVIPTVSRSEQNLPNKIIYHICVSPIVAEQVMGIPFPKGNRSFSFFKVLPEGLGACVRKLVSKAEATTVYHLQTTSGKYCCPVMCYNTKMKEISAVITEKNAKEWMKKAEKMSSRELAEAAKIVRKKDTKDSDVPSITTLTLRMTEAEANVILEAIEEAKSLCDSTNAVIALEMICQDWLTAKGVTPERTSLKDYIAYIEKLYGVKVSVKQETSKKKSDQQQEAADILDETNENGSSELEEDDDTPELPDLDDVEEEEADDGEDVVDIDDILGIAD